MKVCQGDLFADRTPTPTMRAIRRRTRVVGAFPDGNSALMLVAARLRHIAGSKWSDRRYLDMDLLEEAVEAWEAGASRGWRRRKMRLDGQEQMRQIEEMKRREQRAGGFRTWRSVGASRGSPGPR